MRKTPLVTGEHYHIFNRGVDKRDIFLDYDDLNRFYKSVQIFNSVEPIGSIFETSFETWRSDRQVEDKLVEIVAYCLNPNHFHLLLKQVVDNGISEFMKRIGGYTWYFNNKYSRTGSLFGGKFKSLHIDTNEYLLHVSVYINLNSRLANKKLSLSKSSWEEYISDSTGICNPSIVLEQYTNKDAYKKFATSSFEDIVVRKEQEKELQYLFN